MLKALVTGGTGFVGSNLCHRLIKENIEVNILIRHNSDTSQLINIKDKINICKYDGTMESMAQIFNNVKPDIVFHLASYFVAEHKTEDISKLINSNITMGVHLLEGMKNENVKYFINTGTNWQNYHSENYNPVDLYAATKEALENIAQFYIDTTNIRMITLKLSDTYGPRDNRGKIINKFKEVAYSGEILNMSKGEQKLGFVYIDDVLEAYILGMKRIQKLSEHCKESYVVIPHKCYSLKEIVNIFEKVYNAKLNINWGAREYRQREVMEPYIGKQIEDWEAKITFEEGLRMIKQEDSYVTK